MFKRLLVFGSLLAVVAAPLVPLSAQALTSSDNDDAIYLSSSAGSDFYAFLGENYNNTSKQYYEDFATLSQQAETELRQAAIKFNTSGLDGKEADAIKRMKAATLDDANVMSNWRKAVAANDLRAATVASAADDQASADYNAAYDDYSRAKYFLTDAQYSLLYWVLFIVAASVTVATLLWLVLRNYGCRHKRSEREKQLEKARRSLLLASLWPVAGASATLLSFYNTVGGVYVVLWGAVIAGAAVYIRQLYVYKFETLKKS